MALTGKTCEVIGGKLRLRAAASDGGTVLAFMPEGAKVYCSSDNGTWAKVKYDTASKSYSGYCKSEYLQETDDGTDSETATTDTESDSTADADADEGTVAVTLTATQVEAIKAIAAML